MMIETRVLADVCAVVSSTRNADGKGEHDVEIVQDTSGSLKSASCSFRHSVAHCTDTQIVVSGMRMVQ